MFVLTVILTVALATAMALSFARKARGAPDSRALRDRLRVPPSLWLAIGGLEACAAVGLLAGLVAAPLGVAAAGGVALLMAGAVAAHLRRRIGGGALAAPVGLLVAAAAVLVLRTATA
jgi:hypothetical protein